MVFATLDTKMSLVNLSNKKKIILSDTVGFISALPTELIDSFNSSLEELFSSDYLLLVHDLSNPNIENEAKLVFDTLKEIGFNKDVRKLVYHQAKLASKAKLDAIVCSPQEVAIVKKVFKKEIITPGIRLNLKANDQKRVLTPKQAYKNVSSALC